MYKEEIEEDILNEETIKAMKEVELLKEDPDKETFDTFEEIIEYIFH